MSRQLKIGQYLLLGKGEEATGGRDRESILADTAEAIIGAIYLDSDYKTVRGVLGRNFKKNLVDAASEGALFIDYKTTLQEKIQKEGNARIEYIVDKEEGPDHGKVFYMNVCIDNEVISMGKGKNKKEAEQNAAKKALKKLGECK